MIVWVPFCPHCRLVMLAIKAGWFCPKCGTSRGSDPYTVLVGA